MSSSGPFDRLQSEREQSFATTRWSIVVLAGQGNSPQSKEALASLCEIYWFPVYSFVRSRVAGMHDAQDLTQSFFAHLLEREAISKADPDRGRFRAFLLTAIRNFMSNERERSQAEKRGGQRIKLSLDFDSGEVRYQAEPFHHLTADKLFERRWVIALLDYVMDVLRKELAQSGKESYFAEFKDALTGSTTDERYESAAKSLGMTPAAAKQAAYRMRKRYRELFRQEVARTVADDEHVDEEIHRLLETLRS